MPKDNVTIDFKKMDGESHTIIVDSPKSILDNKHERIQVIYDLLSVSTQGVHFEDIYSLIESYVSECGRWIYSDISNHIFCASTQTQGIYMHNLDALLEYAAKCHQSCSKAESCSIREDVLKAIEKLYDHSNLAIKQSSYMRQDKEVFESNFNDCIAPFKADFSNELNKQLISLIAIFTALSFIVFGGISSLESIFLGAKSIPLIKLIIVGIIWGFCIINLVFTFIYFVSKLTGISIKTTNKSDSTIGQRFPFVLWTNMALVVAFLVTCFIYFVDYTNSGTWLIVLTQNHPVCTSICGGVIIILFALAFYWLFNKKPKN